MNFSKYVISQSSTVCEALKALNKLSSDSLTLFVVDNLERMVGTLTDGDVRRKIIDECSLSDSVSKVMHRKFSYILESDSDVVKKIREIKSKHITLIPVLDENRHIKNIYNLKKIRSCLPVDAVLMAGGKGERLRPLTEKTPKPLLLVGNKAIIDYNIERLMLYGINNIFVTVNYLKEQIEEHFAEPMGNVQIQCVREPQYLGTIGSVKFIKSFTSDVVLVMNSDLFTNIDYEDFFLHFKLHQADMSVAAVPYTVSIPYGIFDLEGRNIRGLIEKPTYNYYVNAGIYLIKRELLKEIPTNHFFDATDFIQKLADMNKKVVRFPINGSWIDIGNHQEFQKAQDLVKHLYQ